MQGHPTWNPTAIRSLNRNTFLTLIVLMLFLLIGAGIGYLAASSAVHTATLNVQVENDTGVTQDVRIFLNDDQVAVVTIANGQSATIPLKVGWTNTASGLYEVRATPVTNGASDTDTVTVSSGQTLLVALRVR